MKCLTHDMRLCKQSPAGGDMTGHELQDSRFGRDGVQSPKAPFEPSPLPSMEATVVLLAGLPPACTRLQLCKIWLKQIPGNVKWGRRKTEKIQAQFKTLELTNITHCQNCNGAHSPICAHPSPKNTWWCCVSCPRKYESERRHREVMLTCFCSHSKWQGQDLCSGSWNSIKH